MSGVALFMVGVFVTIVAAAGIGLLVWGAILDGRDQRERDAASVVPLRRGDRLDDAA